MANSTQSENGWSSSRNSHAWDSKQPQNGIGLQRDALGTVSTASKPGKGESGRTLVSADPVAKSSSVFSQIRNTVPGDATIGHERQNISRPWNALSAEHHSDGINTASEPKPAAVRVAQSYAGSGDAAVYDLMVEDAHEFVANGVIVHNCVWAFFDLKDLVSASWLEAYNVSKCEKCEKPFFRSIDGVPRKSCPFCSAPLEDE